MSATGPVSSAARRRRERRGHAAPARPATEAEIDKHLGNVAAEILDLATSPMITAWAVRP
jgi:hypothetical protein